MFKSVHSSLSRGSTARSSFHKLETLEKRVCLAGVSPTIPLVDPDLVAIDDFNADGFADIVHVINDPSTNSARIVQRSGIGNGGFAAPVESTVDFLVSDVLHPGAGAADPQFDRQIVLITPRQIPSSTIFQEVAATVLEGDGLTNVRFSTLFTAVGAPAQSNRWLSHDVNGDDRSDIIRVSNGTVGAFFSMGDGSYQITCIMNQPFAPGATDFAAGDFNGDGNGDVIARVGGVVQVSLGAGNGFFNDAVNVTLSPKPISALAAGDVDADGIDDIVATFGNDFVSTAFGDSAGAFTRRARDNDSVAPSVARLIATDMNGDLRTDLFGLQMQNGTATFTRATGDGTGNFTALSNSVRPRRFDVGAQSTLPELE